MGISGWSPRASPNMRGLHTRPSRSVIAQLPAPIKKRGAAQPGVAIGRVGTVRARVMRLRCTRGLHAVGRADVCVEGRRLNSSPDDLQNALAGLSCDAVDERILRSNFVHPVIRQGAVRPEVLETT